MEPLSTVSPPANELQQSADTVASNGSANSLEYSDVQLVMVGGAMAILVVAIVFGKFRHFSINFRADFSYNTLHTCLILLR